MLGGISHALASTSRTRCRWAALVALEAGEDRRESVVLLTKSGRKNLTRGLPLGKKAQSIVEAKLGRAEADNLQNALRKLCV